MRHYDEELLILYAARPDSCSEHAEITAHLAECPECEVLLHSIRLELGDEKIGDDGPLDSVLDLEGLLTKEEERGAVTLRDYLSQSLPNPNSVTSTFLTLGGLRALLKELPGIRRNNPAGALRLSETALLVSEGVDRRLYPPIAIAHLRGVLWKEQAATLRVLGRFSEALTALDHAEDQLSGATTDYELAGVWYVRAATLREIDELDTAAFWLAEAMEVYRRFGDTRKQHRAEYLNAAILYRQGSYAAARSLFHDLLSRVQRDSDTQTEAMILNALGQCAIDLQDFVNAEELLQQALTSYQRAGLELDTLRVRWGLARLHVSMGSFIKGIADLRRVQADYRTRQLPDETNLIGLDLADALLALDRREEAAKVCEEVMAGLRSTGSAPNILRAVEYLREATQKQNATRALISQVRSFIEESPRFPHRQFQPLL